MAERQRRRRITILDISAEALSRTEAAELAIAHAHRNPKRVRRAPQPGRRPPRRPVRAVVEEHDLDSDLSVSEGASDVDDEERQWHRASSAAKSGERVRRNHEAFANRRARDSECILRAAARRAAKLEREQAAFAAELQQRWMQALQDHSCFYGRDEAEVEQLTEVVAAYKVMVVTLHTDTAVQIPTVNCKFCSRQAAVSACDMYCFPCQPVVDTVWVDDAVLMHTASLLMDSSCSMTAAHAALSHLRTVQRGEPAVLPFTVK